MGLSNCAHIALTSQDPPVTAVFLIPAFLAAFLACFSYPYKLLLQFSVPLDTMNKLFRYDTDWAMVDDGSHIDEQAQLSKLIPLELITAISRWKKEISFFQQ